MNRGQRHSIDEQLLDAPLFRGISKGEAQLVSSLTTRLEYPAGSVLARQGDLGREFLIVVHGQVEVRCDDEIVASRGPGDHVGEIALLDDCARTATLVAKTPVVFDVMAQREFTTLMVEVEGFSNRIHESAAQRRAELVQSAVRD
ncbi:MAG TPA: cyclic nucleotide-binding domain-containing protein [Acidimicrobiia bacterium]